MASETESDLATIAYMAGVADEKVRGRAAVAELVEALEEVKRTLEEPQPAIACTIWAATSPAETLYDHVCTALSRHQAGLGKGDERG